MVSAVRDLLIRVVGFANDQSLVDVEAIAQRLRHRLIRFYMRLIHFGNLPSFLNHLQISCGSRTDGCETLINVRMLVLGFRWPEVEDHA